jgi:hypothetical protein
MNLFEVAKELAGRVAKIFLRGKDGRRPVYGRDSRVQTDPYWPDHLLFYEYFDGDTGAGLGASHQTGWTGLASMFVYFFETLNAESVLKEGLISFVSAIAGPRGTHASPAARRPPNRKKPALGGKPDRNRRVASSIKPARRAAATNL